MSMPKISDLTGIGQFLSSLLKVSSAGIGRVTKSTFDKEDIDTEAYRIKRIAETVRENNDLLGLMSYDDGRITINSKHDNNAPDITQRTQSRLEFQDIRSQQNIESIIQKTVSYAASNSDGLKENSTEDVDPDWINRFFKSAEDISNDEMQELWARVLTGEVKSPGSYSLRTLELLRNLTKVEATLFEKLASYAIRSSSDYIFLYCYKDIRETLKMLDIKYSEFLTLTELGLVLDNSTMILNLSETGEFLLSTRYGNKGSVTVKPESVKNVKIPTINFTKVGMELAKLVTQNWHNIYHPLYEKAIIDFGFVEWNQPV